MEFQMLTFEDRETEKPSKTGYLAEKFGGVAYRLEVLQSAAGYYLGTVDENRQPFTRESAEYWSVREQAEAALSSAIPGAWTQRFTL